MNFSQPVACYLHWLLCVNLKKHFLNKHILQDSWEVEVKCIYKTKRIHIACGTFWILSIITFPSRTKEIIVVFKCRESDSWSVPSGSVMRTPTGIWQKKSSQLGSCKQKESQSKLSWTVTGGKHHFTKGETNTAQRQEYVLQSKWHSAKYGWAT